MKTLKAAIPVAESSRSESQGQRPIFKKYKSIEKSSNGGIFENLSFCPI